MLPSAGGVSGQRGEEQLTVVGLEEVCKQRFKGVPALLQLGPGTSLLADEVEELVSQPSQLLLPKLDSPLLLRGAGLPLRCCGLLRINQHFGACGDPLQISQRRLASCLVRRFGQRPVHVAQLFDDLPLGVVQAGAGSNGSSGSHSASVAVAATSSMTRR